MKQELGMISGMGCYVCSSCQLECLEDTCGCLIGLTDLLREQ